MIDFTKPIQTRDGRKVRILCTDCPDPSYPVVALVAGAPGQEPSLPRVYGADGRSFPSVERPEDLVNVPAFDPTKPVRTRDGHAARILCTDRIAHPGQMHVICALVLIGGQEVFCFYTGEGRQYATSESDYDLVNI